ncbi:MAG: hypothetical protein HY084_11730 [Gemmatimonadetes bacterium]|nr:hypothetical protein [Gemmatimonadota bacterium]
MSLLLSGCMMPGMVGMGGVGGGGTHGGDHASAAVSPTVIKETVLEGIRVTATFPPFMLGDTPVYSVTVMHVLDKSPVNDASVSLIVATDEGRGPAESTGHAHTDARDVAAAAPRALVAGTTWSPTTVSGGSYVFRPSIATEGTYRLVVVVERAGNRVLDPRAELEHVVQFRRVVDQHGGDGGGMHGVGATALVLAGAAVMVLMMAVTLR